jgi:hypothetical protein
MIYTDSEELNNTIDRNLFPDDRLFNIEMRMFSKTTENSYNNCKRAINKNCNLCRKCMNEFNFTLY